MKKARKFKKGAASFYIVAIATLLLVIIATSFIAVIISEITRTSNNDLAQSAYDSALAGVEDAKLAYYNYYNCVKNGAEKAEGLNGDGNISCDEIRFLVEKYDDDYDCNMTSWIVGRKTEGTESEVLVEEAGTASNNMQQAYTCVVFKTQLDNQVGELSGNNPTKVVVPVFSAGNDANDVTAIKVSWQSLKNEEATEPESEGIGDYRYTDLSQAGIFGFDGRVGEEEAPEGDYYDILPPVLSVGLVQTSANFKMEDFDAIKEEGGIKKTNRGTLYLVPAKSGEPVLPTEDYIGAEYGFHVKEEGFLRSNDKEAETKNVPYVITCSDPDSGEGGGYLCSALIDLPKTIGGNRIGDTFRIVLSLPYASVGDAVGYDVEFFKDDATTIADKIRNNQEVQSIKQEGVQVEVDSTGRANDLYRRVVTRLNVSGNSNSYPAYAIELLGGNESGSLIRKDIWTTCEWDFNPTC